MNKESLQKAYKFISNAQDEVCLRFTDDKDCDKLVNEAYNELDKIKEKMIKIVEVKKWWKR